MYYRTILYIRIITNSNIINIPLITALNQTEQLSPIITSPTIVLFSARKQLVPISGKTFLTGRISAIKNFIKKRYREDQVHEVYNR